MKKNSLQSPQRCSRFQATHPETPFQKPQKVQPAAGKYNQSANSGVKARSTTIKSGSYQHLQYRAVQSSPVQHLTVKVNLTRPHGRTHGRDATSSCYMAISLFTVPLASHPSNPNPRAPPPRRTTTERGNPVADPPLARLPAHLTDTQYPIPLQGQRALDPDPRGSASYCMSPLRKKPRGVAHLNTFSPLPFSLYHFFLKLNTAAYRVRGAREHVGTWPAWRETPPSHPARRWVRKDKSSKEACWSSTSARSAPPPLPGARSRFPLFLSRRGSDKAAGGG